MMSLRSFAVGVLLAAATASAAMAEPVTYTIDTSHSQVGFNVRHWFSRVPGRFNDFQGTIHYDDKDVTKSVVDVTIKTASIYTNNERRDNHLRSADFFAADSFPDMTFKSTKITPAGENKYKVDGNLTIRGITKPVTLETSFLGAGNLGQMGLRAGWSATTTINRKDFNVLWNRTLDQGGAMLGDDVVVQIDIEGMKRPDAPPAGAANTKK